MKKINRIFKRDARAAGQAVDVASPGPAADPTGADQPTIAMTATGHPASADQVSGHGGPPQPSDEETLALPQRPGFRLRGRLRRRLRYLQSVRELGYRDLGGLVFDQHRFERHDQSLIQAKVGALDAIDRESRAISDALGRPQVYDELFLAGVSACQRCGAVHGSDAHFCPNCGLMFSGPRLVTGLGGGEQPVTTPAPSHTASQPAIEQSTAPPTTTLEAGIEPEAVVPEAQKDQATPGTTP